MVLDDKLPVSIDGKLLFSEPNKVSQSLWSVLLEKAWSKINVNYEHTCAGWCHEVLRVFIGAGAKDYIISQLTEQQLWDILVEGQQKGFLMGSGTKGGGDHTYKLANGLSQSHAYSILDVKEIKDKMGNKFKAIKIRNPWSTEGYNAELSDQDFSFWSTEVLTANNHVLKNDGIFWISLKQFKDSMLYMVVTKYHKGWTHNYIISKDDDGNEHTYLFDIDETNQGPAYIRCDQYDHRMYPPNSKPDKVMSNYVLYKYNQATGVYDKIA